MFAINKIIKNNIKKNIKIISFYNKRNLSYLDSWNGDDTEVWPKRHANTIVNVCPEGEAMVIERLGSFHHIQTGGMFVAIPLVDNIRFVIDMRERALSVDPQSCITKDNVHVQVSGNLYCQFIDAKKAAYGAKNPLYAVRQHAQSSMRAAIGELELDQILHDRVHLNNSIRSTVQEAAANWGIEIKRYEITEVRPDDHIMEAMDKQAAGERERRKQVLQAEGNKRQLELESEGRKIQLANESEGELIKIKNEAEAHKQRIILEAEAEAFRIIKKAEAQSIALKEIASALEKDSVNGLQAAKLNIAREYIAMYSDIGQKSNTMIFSDRPADVQTLMAQANAVLNASKKSD